MMLPDETLRAIPPQRLLTEMDHPYGDRRTSGSKPGHVVEAGQRLASRRGIELRMQRVELWRNLRNLVKDTGDEGLLATEGQASLRGGDRP